MVSPVEKTVNSRIHIIPQNISFLTEHWAVLLNIDITCNGTAHQWNLSVFPINWVFLLKVAVWTWKWQAKYNDQDFSWIYSKLNIWQQDHAWICHMQGLRVDEKGSVVVSHPMRNSIHILKMAFLWHQGARGGSSLCGLPPLLCTRLIVRHACHSQVSL